MKECPFMCFYKTAVDHLQTVQNTVARLLTGTKRREDTTLVLSSFNWLPDNFRFCFEILVIAFRALPGQAPSYITDLLRFYCPVLSLRSSDLLVPLLCTCFKTREALSCSTTVIGCTSSIFICYIESIDSFRKKLKTYLFRRALKLGLLLRGLFLYLSFLIFYPGLCSAVKHFVVFICKKRVKITDHSVYKIIVLMRILNRT